MRIPRKWITRDKKLKSMYMLTSLLQSRAISSLSSMQSLAVFLVW